jgi:hypothetical protein
MRDQAEILKHNPDPSPEPGKAIPRHRHDALAENADFTTAWPMGEI